MVEKHNLGNPVNSKRVQRSLLTMWPKTSREKSLATQKSNVPKLCKINSSVSKEIPGEPMDIDYVEPNSERTHIRMKPTIDSKGKATKFEIKPRNNQGDFRRKWCPVFNCKYHGGKGLIDRSKHLKTHWKEFDHQSHHFLAIKEALEEDECNWKPCVSCKKLVGYTNDKDICLRCIDSEEKEEVIDGNRAQSHKVTVKMVFRAATKN